MALHLLELEATKSIKRIFISMKQFYFRSEIFTPAVETADGVDAIEPDAETLESFGCCIVKDGCLKRFPVVPSNSSLKS